WLLFALLSSDGTEIVITSLPSTVGVKGANVTVAEPPQLGSDAIVCVFVKDSAPVIVSVTGRVVSVLLPLFRTSPWLVWGPPRPRGPWPCDMSPATAPSFAGTVAVRRVSGRKELAASVVGAVVP